MILRRLNQHVRDQNWIAVGLDFLIVILGVFIGIQLGNWNTNRLETARAEANMGRLQEEAEHVVAYWQDQVNSSSAFKTAQRALLLALEDGKVPAGQEDAIEVAFQSLFFYPANNPPRAVLDELTATGGLSSLTDLEVRDAVSEYLAELAYIDGQLPQFRLNAPVIVNAYRDRVFSVYAPDRPSLRRFEYDMEALSQDRQFNSDILDLARDQLQFHEYRLNMLEAARQMCDTVSGSIDTVCKANPAGLVDRNGVNQRAPQD